MPAWSEREWDDAIEFAEALLNWRDRDGFPPKTIRHAELGSDFNRQIAFSSAWFALNRAKSVLADPNGIPADVAFILYCANCNNEGPTSFAEAISQGWTAITYVPAGLSENFLGGCGKCEDRD